MSELTMFTYVLIMVATIYCGVHVYTRWINHVTIYGVVWGIQLVLFQMRLIKYPDFSMETTVFVFGAWAIFILASLTITNFYSLRRVPSQESRIGSSNLLASALVGLTVIGAIGTLQHWMVLIKVFGGVKNAIISGNLIYSMSKREGGIPGMWPYIDSVSLSADFFGGVFAGLRKRPFVLGIFPFVVELANAVSGFGRSRLIIGAILWGTAFFFPRARKALADRKTLAKRALTVSFIVFILVFGMQSVLTLRGGRESFTGETTALSHIKGAGFITPSIYMYLSCDIPVLNKFLSYQFSGNVEHTPPGGYTFAPFYRFISKFGIVDPMPVYDKFYNVPVGTNTGSYLRELYIDWGIGGSLLIVYLLGAICSTVYETYQRKKSLAVFSLLAHLYVVVFFTFAVMATAWTYWLISLVFSVLVGLIIDKFTKMVPHARVTDTF